jgi:hypothetical protein
MIDDFLYFSLNILVSMVPLIINLKVSEKAFKTLIEYKFQNSREIGCRYFYQV